MHDGPRMVLLPEAAGGRTKRKTPVNGGHLACHEGGAVELQSAAAGVATLRAAPLSGCGRSEWMRSSGKRYQKVCLLLARSGRSYLSLGDATVPALHESREHLGNLASCTYLST